MMKLNKKFKKNTLKRELEKIDNKKTKQKILMINSTLVSKL